MFYYTPNPKQAQPHFEIPKCKRLLVKNGSCNYCVTLVNNNGGLSSTYHFKNITVTRFCTNKLLLNFIFEPVFIFKYQKDFFQLLFFCIKNI